LSESAVSNIRRLLKLPDALQKSVANNELSVDCARALATWAEFPKVVERLTEKLKDGSIPKEDFDWSLRHAVVDASRRMKAQPSWGGNGCDFRPTEQQKKDLDIREVRIGKTPAEKRAFNVALWDQLQREAKKRKKSRAAKAADDEQASTAKGKGTKSEQPKGRKRSEYEFTSHRDLAWRNAFRAALAKRIDGKLSQGDRETLFRIGLFILPYHTGVAEVLALKPEEAIKLVKADVGMKLGPWDHPQLELKDVQALADIFGVDGTPHFTPSAQLLQACGDADLVALAKSIDVDVSKLEHKARIAQLSKGWPREEVPELFQLSKPKAKKGKKR